MVAIWGDEDTCVFAVKLEVDVVTKCFGFILTDFAFAKDDGGGDGECVCCFCFSIVKPLLCFNFGSGLNSGDLFSDFFCCCCIELDALEIILNASFAIASEYTLHVKCFGFGVETFLLQIEFADEVTPEFEICC